MDAPKGTLSRLLEVFPLSHVSNMTIKSNLNANIKMQGTMTRSRVVIQVMWSRLMFFFPLQIIIDTGTQHLNALEEFQKYV